jgi:acyl-CoA-dependent ceramide synthase
LIVSVLYLSNPSPSNPLHAALFLSYPIPHKPSDDPSTPIQYGKGSRDFAFVAFYTIFLSFTREFIMQRFLRPLARSLGIHSRAKQARFMEQAYTALYFAIFGPFGLYVMYRSPLWYFRTEPMYETFPNRQHEGLFKAYYLLQASYWTQQMIVLLLMLEKPRKDFKELVAHHIITLALIWLSYRFHFTHMGIAVYITHDISDFFLAVSRFTEPTEPTLPPRETNIPTTRPPKSSTMSTHPS